MHKPWVAHYDLPVPDPLPIPAMTIPEVLRATATAHPAWIATILDGNELTYGQIDERADRFAAALAAMGVARGDRVALLVPNSPTYLIACFGALRAGAVLVNLGVMTRGPELARLLGHTAARVVVTLDLFLDGVLKACAAGAPSVEHIVFHSVAGMEQMLAPPAPATPAPKLAVMMDLLRAHPAKPPAFDPPLRPPLRPDDLAVLQPTSGTTATPKLVMLSHRNVVANVWQLMHARVSPGGDNEAAICVLPFFHVFGFTVCLMLSVARGLRMVLMPRFDPTSILPLVQLVARTAPVSLPAVPSLWAALVRQGEAVRELLARLPMPSSGGAPLGPVQGEFQRLTGRAILEAYGLSEASSTTHMMPALAPLRPGSIGVPLPDTDARIVDPNDDAGDAELPPGTVGELVVRGPQVMMGYWRDEARTSRALRGGWLRTGDLARMDDDGYFYIVDRKDDLIITNGFNVYPSEIESVLARHGAVREAVVVGAPDPLRGQVIRAAVVLREGATATVEELLDWCRAELAEYKVPRSLRIASELARSPTGKPLRAPLRE